MTRRIAIGVMLAAVVSGHELQDNRATIVLRDKVNLSFTLFLNYGEALRRVLMPERPYAEFLVACSAMKPEKLQQELARAEAKFQAETKLILEPGGEVRITHWIWPDAKGVQELLRQQVMQAMVDAGNHAHEQPLEVHAQYVARQEVESFRIQFPEAFQQVVVVAFRPQQVTVEGGALSKEINFQRD